MKQPSNTLKQQSEPADSAETELHGSCFRRCHDNSRMDVTMERATSIHGKLDKFKRKFPSQLSSHRAMYIPQAGHRGKEEMLSNVLDICCKFCETANRAVRQVPFYCPFQVYIPIYF